MAKGRDFPEIIYNALAVSPEPRKIEYKSYHQYLEKSLRNFPDISPLEVTTRFDPREPPKTVVYTLDIGQYSTHIQNDSYSIHAHTPMRGATDMTSHLTEAPTGTKLRMLFCYYDHMEHDPIIFENLASFYDINPRSIQDHQWRTVFNAGLDVTRLSIHDTCPAFLPSEAHFSPIQLERAVQPRRKKMSALLTSGPSHDFSTVLVLVCQTSNCYSRNVINRDILFPTLYNSPEHSEKWRQPENEAETTFLRLSRLSSMELEACVSQPIISILPMVRSHCMETSQDVYQIREHISRFGLGEAGVDHRYATNKHPDHHWGTKETDPFKAFQRIHWAFTTGFRSLHDHLSSPWMDTRKPHMEYTTHVVDIALKDVQRIMDEVSELREVLKESSSLILAKESIVEARRSAAQAESVTQLTRLAFIFIPLTFATSVFGMNIEEWQDDVPRFRWFIVTSVCCTTLTMISALLLRKLSPSFRAWVQENRGFWRGVGHFVRDILIFLLLTLAVTVPRIFNDSVGAIGNWLDFRSRMDAKKNSTAAMV